jgi:methionyl-tRNA formyltransferase
MMTAPLLDTPLRIVFAGSPEAATPSLRLLAGSRHDVAAVVTREDSPQGRKHVLTPTAVAAVAAELGLPVLKSNRVGALTDDIRALRPDLGVIVAYGGLIREPLLTLPRLGWINLHFSLLPRWRGAAPVQRAIIAGDEITGATVFQLVPELDAGAVYGQFTQAIAANETAGHLLHSLADAGAQLLLRVLDALADGTARAEPQSGDVTSAPKLGIEDGRIDWSEHGAVVSNLIRGVTPEPGAFTMVDGARVKVLAATAAPGIRMPAGQFGYSDGRVLVGTGSDALELLAVQPAGKNPMPAADWWRGRRTTATIDGTM